MSDPDLVSGTRADGLRSAPRWRFAGAGALACALLCLALVACSTHDEGPPQPPIEVEEVVTCLLDDTRLPTIEEQNDRFPVKFDLMMPRGSGLGDYAEMAALEVTPPCRVRIPVPSFPPEAKLEFAYAVRRQSYLGKGKVHLRMEQGGQAIWSAVLDSSESVPEGQRKWFRVSQRIAPEQELLLTSSYEGDQPRPPRVGIGLLELRRPHTIPRRSAKAKGHNLILILVDTLRADGLHTYGNERSQTPNLDALAARGTVYERAYSSAPWTVPSTATVLTGLTVAEHGLGFSASNYLAHGFVTIAEALQNEGWTTGGFSANTLISASRNFDQGFESYHDYRWTNTSGMIDDIEAWLGEQASRRFFLYLHLVDPHGAYLPEEPFRSRLAPDVPADLEVQPKLVMDSYWRGEVSDAELEEYAIQSRKLYDGEIAWLDDLLGRLFAHLQSLGVLDDTILALTSDHGEEFMDHGLMGHVSQLHQELLHVPLLLAGPGVPAAKRVDQPVENRFVPQTLLDLVGVSARANLKGVDLLSKKDLSAYAGEPIFSATRNGRFRLASGEWSDRRTIYGCQQGRWQFFWAPPVGEGDVDHYALYDREQDPEAHHDLSAEQVERCVELRKTVKAWLDRSYASRPSVRLSGEADHEEMKALGYVGDD